MGTPERDQLPCRECGRPFRKVSCEQRLCRNPDRGKPDLYRGEDGGCWERTEQGLRHLSALEKQERRRQRKRDRLWKRREKVNRALERLEQARRELQEQEARGEGGPDRRTRGQSGPAKNVQGPDGKFVRTTPPRQPQETRKKRKAWFKCRIGRCVGSMTSPCSGCGIAESPQDAQNVVLSDSADRTLRRPDGTFARKDESTVKENPSEPPESPVSVSQNPTSETPARPTSRAGRGRRPRRMGSPPYSGRDQAVLRFVADAKEAREKQDEEESLIETTSNPLLED